MPVCKKCGYDNREGNDYCVNCGAKLDSASETEKTQHTAEASPSTQQVARAMNTQIGMTIIFVLLGALVFGGVYYLSIPKAVTYIIEITSDTSWSGSIGADGSSRTIEGYGNENWKVTGIIAVAVIQKQTEYGFLTVRILRDGTVLDSQTTTAAYGVVSVSAR